LNGFNISAPNPTFSATPSNLLALTRLGLSVHCGIYSYNSSFSTPLHVSVCPCLSSFHCTPQLNVGTFLLIPLMARFRGPVSSETWAAFVAISQTAKFNAKDYTTTAACVGDKGNGLHSDVDTTPTRIATPLSLSSPASYFPRLPLLRLYLVPPFSLPSPIPFRSRYHLRRHDTDPHLHCQLVLPAEYADVYPLSVRRAELHSASREETTAREACY
jgi:hypothetical protein